LFKVLQVANQLAIQQEEFKGIFSLLALCMKFLEGIILPQNFQRTFNMGNRKSRIAVRDRRKTPTADQAKSRQGIDW
jgi:hypothetical protein